MPRPRRTAAVAAAVAALSMAAACGDDDPGTGATGTTGPSRSTTDPATGATDEPSTTAAAPDLPPQSEADLAALYAPVLEPLGVEFTRGSVIVNPDGGAHLALYVVPTDGAAAPQDYLDRVLALNAALDPLLFEEFDDLVSFDICQEPVPEPGSEERYPPPQVLLFMSRDGFESVDDWSTATLADLMVAVQSDPDGEFDVVPEIEQLPDWAEADAQAEF